MRVLLTGHDGYIGRVLQPMLEADDHDVVGLDSYLYWGCGLPTQSDAGLERPGSNDVRDVRPEQLEGLDAIVHLAGISNDPLGSLERSTTFAINYVATTRLARAARAAGISRFVFASSCSIYGASDGEFIDETAPHAPVTPYAFSKVMAEADLQGLAGDDFSPVFLRNATAYGMSPRLRGDLVVNNLTAHAYTTGKVLLKSDGSAWRPLVHVSDIARAIVSALRAPRERIHNQAINIGGSSENYTIADVAEIVAAGVPGARIQRVSGASADTRCYRVDCSKQADLLPDSIPTRTVADGVAELVDAFTAGGLSARDVESSWLIRLARVREAIDAGRLDKHLRWTSMPASIALTQRTETPADVA